MAAYNRPADIQKRYFLKGQRPFLHRTIVINGAVPFSRNAWLDYKMGLGKTLRLGHFDPDFGLEPLLDTHATLLETLAKKNVGFKKDWGIGYRGSFSDYDYQLTAGLGSGMGIRYKDGRIEEKPA